MKSAPALTWESISLKLINPFALSYGTTDTRQANWIRLANDEGWGEGTIPPYYGVDSAAMQDCWRQAAAQTKPLPETIEEIPAWIPTGPAPARCALELALFDRIGKRAGKPLYQLLNLPRPPVLATCFTISIDAPDAMARIAKQIADYPIIKLKLGSDDDRARVSAVRVARPDARMVVDANAGWTFDEAIENLRWLETLNIELIEQPLAKDQHAAMGKLQQKTSIPIVADESVQTPADVEKLAAGGVKGINLKLMKLGGLTPALAILRRGREHGMTIMLGCMMETSIGITAMSHLAGHADWLDLDAPLLIKNDPFDGIHFDRHAKMTIPDRPGIGVIKKPEALQ